MAHEEHKIAQDGLDKPQDEARPRQDAKHEGCLQSFGPVAPLRARTIRQQLREPRPWGGPPLREWKTPPDVGSRILIASPALKNLAKKVRRPQTSAGTPRHVFDTLR